MPSNFGNKKKYEHVACHVKQLFTLSPTLCYTSLIKFCWKLSTRITSHWMWFSFSPWNLKYPSNGCSNSFLPPSQPQNPISQTNRSPRRTTLCLQMRSRKGLKTIGCINERVNLDKCLYSIHILAACKKYLFPIQLFLRIWPTRYYRETYLLRSGSNMLTSLNIARNNAILKCC